MDWIYEVDSDNDEVSEFGFDDPSVADYDEESDGYSTIGDS